MNPDAPLWRRLFALVYDAFLLFGLLMIYGYAVVLLQAKWLGTDIEHSPTAGGNPLVFAGAMLLVAGFYCMFWLKNRQTLGMQAWRIQIETVDGTPLTLGHCLKRAAASLVSMAAAGLGYWWCLLPGHRTWHDHLSGTRITVHDKRQ